MTATIQIVLFLLAVLVLVESRRRLERDLDLEEAAILTRREGETSL